MPICLFHSAAPRAGPAGCSTTFSFLFFVFLPPFVFSPLPFFQLGMDAPALRVPANLMGQSASRIMCPPRSRKGKSIGAGLGTCFAGTGQWAEPPGGSPEPEGGEGGGGHFPIAGPKSQACFDFGAPCPRTTYIALVYVRTPGPPNPARLHPPPVASVRRFGAALAGSGPSGRGVYVDRLPLARW